MSSTSTGNANFFFGFDLLYKTIEKSVRRKSDVLVALVHFVLMRHSNFRCLGVGEDKTLLSTEVGSELLPDGWNDNSEKYALRYKANEQLYLLLGYPSETCFVLNLLDVKSHKVSNVAMELDSIVKKTKGSVTDLVPTASQIANRIRKALIDPVFDGSTREVTTQTHADNSARPDPLRITNRMQPGPYPSPRGVFEPPPSFGSPDYGASDLDQLGRLGQGNIFPLPTRPNNLDVGQPRFDPFGPPNRNEPPNQNPDHLQS